MGLFSSAFLRPKSQKEGMYMNIKSKQKSARIELRVTAKEKEEIKTTG